MLVEGNAVPSFVLKDTEGNAVTEKDLGRAVIYFYPHDMTPNCTMQACDFTDLSGKFEKIGVKIFGVSPDDEKAHQRFTAKHNISFPLLADEDGKMAQAFGVWIEKQYMGNKYMGNQRSTFIVNNGEIEKVWPKVKAEGHAEEVLRYLNG